MRPPAFTRVTEPLLGEMGGFDFIPIQADTKLAAVLHKKRFPFVSACQIIIESGNI